MKSGICFKHQDTMGSQKERRKLLKKSGLEYESKTQYVTLSLFFCDSLRIFSCDTNCVSKFGRGFCSCFIKLHIKNNVNIGQATNCECAFCYQNSGHGRFRNSLFNSQILLNDAKQILNGCLSSLLFQQGNFLDLILQIFTLLEG